MAFNILRRFQSVTTGIGRCSFIQNGQCLLQCIASHSRQLHLPCDYMKSSHCATRRFKIHSDSQKMYFSTIKDHPYLSGISVCLHEDTSDRIRSASKQSTIMDQEVFLGRLHGCVSAKQVFKLLASLETMSDTVAALALQRIAVLEHDQNGLKNPEAVLENDVFKALCFQFEHDSQRLTDAGLVTALHACTQLYVDPWSTLMVRLVSESQERLDRGPMAIKNLCILGEALLALEGPGCGMLKQVMDQVQEQGVEKWSPEEVTMVYNMLQAGVGESGQYQDLLNTLNSFTISIAPKLNPKSISHILNALVVLNQTQAIPLVISLCKHSVRHVPRFSDEELVLLLGAFMHFGQSDRYFIEALERYVPKSTFTMNPEAVSKVMQYCSRRQILSRPIFDSVAQSFVYRADTLSTSQIARQIMPFGKLNYLPPNAGGLFRRVEGILRDRFSQFQPRTLLNLLHSCTLIERFPVNFVAKVFSPYFLQQLEAQGTGLDRIVLAQLTQLFMTVKLECPFYEGPKLHSKYRVKSFQTPGRSLESPVDGHLYNRVKTGLIDLLGARIYFASRVLTPYCYTLDVEIKLDEEGYVLPATHHEEVYKRIAVCIDGQKRFCANSHNFLGKEAIKKRHLKLLGYEVVQIPFYEFEKLNDRNDTVEYLHKKIFPHSYRLSW
ncbi:FAST kinase domain-containing protein 3, mitochondrial [Acipenser ruthenus]|uniref:FAST kinase domain-containing protein 3, mitochondrial n=1 Tax=Acipenser ruthenus TaxID=7906 RepID=UPI00145B761A|nr:FAST kinase domain-containing protein 3, mitochondrial [Acipenser ruthenus]